MGRDAGVSLSCCANPFCAYISGPKVVKAMQQEYSCQLATQSADMHVPFQGFPPSCVAVASQGVLRRAALAGSKFRPLCGAVPGVLQRVHCKQCDRRVGTCIIPARSKYLVGLLRRGALYCLLVGTMLIMLWRAAPPFWE